MKRFVTLVSHIENLELRKDTGQIPYHFHRLLGFDSTIVTYYYTLDGGRTQGALRTPPTDSFTINTNYPFLESETPGLKIHFLENKGRGKFYEKAFLAYLRKESKKIDILNLFHFNTDNMFYAFVYKSINPRGKVYLKLDIDIDFYKSRTSFINFGNKTPLLGPLFQKLAIRLFFRLVTLISAESSQGLAYFKQRFNPPTRKTTLIPNGIDGERTVDLVGKPLSFSEKKNIFLIVGRIGSPQKNISFFLDALTKIDLKDWEVYFVGPIENHFNKEIEQYMRANPKNKDKIIFTGKISDPKTLYNYYNKAKIFCLPSLHEGFPIATCEALFFGCYLLLSNRIYAAQDFCPDHINGQIFGVDTSNELTEILKDIIAGKKVGEHAYHQSIKLSKDQFTWNNNIHKIASILTDVN